MLGTPVVQETTLSWLVIAIEAKFVTYSNHLSNRTLGHPNWMAMLQQAELCVLSHYCRQELAVTVAHIYHMGYSLSTL